MLKGNRHYFFHDFPGTNVIKREGIIFIEKATNIAGQPGSIHFSTCSAHPDELVHDSISVQRNSDKIESNEIEAIPILQVANHPEIHSANHLPRQHIVITRMSISVKKTIFQHFLDNDTCAMQGYTMSVITSFI